MIEIEIIRRICLARHLYELALSSIKSANDLHLFSGVNLLQDAVEAFLVAVADFEGATLNERTNFDQYFVQINEKIKPKELPFKSSLLRLNRIRIDSKHHGIQPARDECQRLSIVVREFFDEVSSSILDVSFSTISAIDLLKKGETKETLVEAKIALDRGDFQECVISCRKAIYLELEYQYDVFDFKDQTNPPRLLSAFSKAPLYAKNKEYIDKNIKDPTDYIVYYHSDLDQELLMYGVDNTAFWNIWRLTPKVYRTKDNNWVVKHDFDKLEPDIIKTNVEYIFSTTINIILAVQTKKESIKTSSYGRHCIELKQEEVPIYEKADATSKVVTTTPKGFTKLYCNYYVTGIQGDGPYWYVYDFKLEPFLYGFIHNDYVKNES